MLGETERVYLFYLNFDSWFFVFFMTSWIIKGKRVENWLSGAIDNTTINTVAFQMNFIDSCDVDRFITFIWSRNHMIKTIYIV